MGWFWCGRRTCVRLLALLAFACCVQTADANAAQLTASWIDNSNGMATTRLERRLSTATTFAVVTDVPPGSTVYVDASVSPGTTYCYRALAFDTSGTSAYTAEVCAASAVDVLTVMVTKTGTGTGTVTSTPAGIACGTTCSATFSAGSTATLSAIPATGSTFTGWGGGCTGTGPCTVAGNGAVSVTANFNVDATAKITPTITFGPAPTPIYLGGNFTVSATTTNTDSSALTYSAVSGPCAPVSGSTFRSTGAGTCVVRAIGAATTNFTAASADLSVVIAKASPTITFGAAPTPTYPGANFIVSATTTNTDSSTLIYSVVSGPCALLSGNTFSATGTGTCVVRASGAPTTNFTAGSADQSVAIAASPSSPTTYYAVTVSVTGPGRVNSTPYGINNCSSTCTAIYPSGTSLTLTATPNNSNGFVFVGWGGACSGTSPTCTIIVGADQSISAAFKKNMARK